MIETTSPDPPPAASTGRRRHRTGRRRRRIATLVVGLMLIAGLAAIWPTRAGGRVTYVMTYGTSMEPHFHAGDLAMLLPASQYRVGDIVAYHSALLGSVVMHRIVAIDGTRYVFKGDHNTWTDPERPTRQDLLGKLWLRVPHGAVLLVALRNMALAATALALIFFAFPSKTKKRARAATHVSSALSSSRECVSWHGASLEHGLTACHLRARTRRQWPLLIGTETYPQAADQPLVSTG